MFKRTVIAASLVAATLASAQSMAAIVGGGATLPEPLYNGKGALGGILPAGFTYVGVGSGGGKTAFLTNDGASINQAGVDVDFAGSDSVLNADDFARYAPVKSAWGNLIQIPSVGTSVTIPYKKSGNTTLQLSGAQLCAAFSGSATTWGALLGTADATPITIVYRSGSSGTTELLTRFLNDSCPASFKVSSTFSSAKLSAVPANWKGVSGSGDVMTQINATEGSIGYISPDYVNPGNNAVVARVSKLPMAAGTAPLPTSANAQVALGTAIAPSNDTDRADPTKWVPTFGAAAGDRPVPSAGYPIVGYTNLLVGQCYKTAADATAIRGFLNDLYSGNKSSLVTAHTFVNLPTEYAGEIKKVFLDNTYGSGLDINNPSVCNGIGRW
ncbi:MAG: substrate-binding domain-containing protein [Paucimonas sp.]|jgi:ABC-type phosphate transport system substrate-binding protein|uniref:substrate-binding domain-containing protein n=1 Tax=Pantoea sp. Cy-639 TaxID=2608360 RepID=UPI00141E7486|nr:substrate-binding domain-containing protein [Pantoea sp. Cy-639]MDR2308406.1 substrate-binding domain-containing protein [Paucimonas sp.]NIF15443.1 protein disulfide reductase [Pantoea sp. Cy-639]